MTGDEREQLMTIRMIADLVEVHFASGSRADLEIARGLSLDLRDRLGRLLWPMTYVPIGGAWDDDEPGNEGLQRFTAVTRGGSRLLTVFAVSLEDARREIERQFERPGRRDVGRVWKDHGRRIENE